MRAAMAEAAQVLSNAIKDKLVQGGSKYPSGNDPSGRQYKPIQDTLTIGPVLEAGSGGLSIDVSVGGPDAPYTKMYEYGKGEYTIEPGNAGFMAFPVGEYPEGRWPDYVGSLLPGDIFMTYNAVTHPEFEARPFVEPAIRDSINTIKKIISREFRIELIGDTEKTVFVPMVFKL